MDFKDIKNLSAKELGEKLVELKSELHELRTQALTRSLKQVHKVSDVRKTIARIMTALKQGSK